jgi:hypothetical protein
MEAARRFPYSQTSRQGSGESLARELLARVDAGRGTCSCGCGPRLEPGGASGPDSRAADGDRRSRRSSQMAE